MVHQAWLSQLDIVAQPCLGLWSCCLVASFVCCLAWSHPNLPRMKQELFLEAVIGVGMMKAFRSLTSASRPRYHGLFCVEPFGRFALPWSSTTSRRVHQDGQKVYRPTRAKLAPKRPPSCRKPQAQPQDGQNLQPAN